MLINLYNNGFIPGPNESEKQFFSRVEATKKIIENPKQYIPKKFTKNGLLTPINKASLLLVGKKNFFIFASSTTIIEIKKNLPIAIITNPSNFSSLFINKKEVIDHELIHAKRASFPNSKYEEFIAYRTSQSFYRKFFSPILFYYIR